MKLKQLKQIIKEEIRTFYEAEGIITPEEVFSPEGQEEKNEWKIGDYTLHYNPESSSYAYEGGTVQLLDHRGEVVAKFGKDPSNDEDSIAQLISAVEAIAQIRATPEEEEELSPETLEEESDIPGASPKHIRRIPSRARALLNSTLDTWKGKDYWEKSNVPSPEFMNKKELYDLFYEALEEYALEDILKYKRRGKIVRGTDFKWGRNHNKALKRLKKAVKDLPAHRKTGRKRTQRRKDLKAAGKDIMGTQDQQALAKEKEKQKQLVAKSKPGLSPSSPAWNKEKEKQHQLSVGVDRGIERGGRHDLKNKSYLETLYRHLVNPKVEGKNKKQAWNLLKKAAEEENNALAKKLLQTYSQKYPSSSFF